MINKLEIAVFYGQLEDMAAAGEKKAVSHTRKDLVDMVKAVWENIEHPSLSRTGYQQTGPLAPLEGPFHVGDFCRDLRDLLKLMCPHDDPQQIENIDP